MTWFRESWKISDWHHRIASFELLKESYKYNLIPESLEELMTIPISNQDIEHYGFLPSDIVRLQKKFQQYDINLSPRSKEKYLQLNQRTEIPATELTNSIADIVNSSMRYEFELIKAKNILNNSPDVAKFYEQVQKTYVPPNDATIPGICSDSGYIIRQLLYQLHPKYPFWYTEAGLRTQENGTRFLHDVTLFFAEKRWVLINSLDPTNNKLVLDKEDVIGGHLQFKDGPEKIVRIQF